MTWTCDQCQGKDSKPHYANEDIRVCSQCGHQNGNPFSTPTFAAEQSQVSTITVEGMKEELERIRKQFPEVKFGPTVKQMKEILEGLDDNHELVAVSGFLWAVRPEMLGVNFIRPVLRLKR